MGGDNNSKNLNTMKIVLLLAVVVPVSRTLSDPLLVLAAPEPEAAPEPDASIINAIGTFVGRGYQTENEQYCKRSWTYQGRCYSGNVCKEDGAALNKPWCYVREEYRSGLIWYDWDYCDPASTVSEGTPGAC